MPEELKKNQKRNDPKDQRRPRKRQEAQVEKKAEPKETPKVVIPQKPPVYESPGPEFYKSLKRETDEILKITEEENSKYKKKEIQSNWSKYEMPIDSYEEIEEQESMGADYEKLIQAPLTVGGHFQFKHEKSWDVNTGPSPYDKYFDINMDNLSLALSTIPFYERNSIEASIFTETDMLNMDNRATRYKQKYFNDKSYTTPEIEAQEKILDSLKENMSRLSEIEAQEKVINELKDNFDNNEEKNDNDDPFNMKDVKCDSIDITNESVGKKFIKVPVDINFDIKASKTETASIKNKYEIQKNLNNNEDAIEQNNSINTTITNTGKNYAIAADDEFIFAKVDTELPVKHLLVEASPVKLVSEVKLTNKDVDTSDKETKNPVIESPEDLEKWLDDFLDD